MSDVGNSNAKLGYMGLSSSAVYEMTVNSDWKFHRFDVQCGSARLHTAFNKSVRFDEYAKKLEKLGISEKYTGQRNVITHSFDS